MVRRSEPRSVLRRSCLSADVLGPLLLVGFRFGLGSGWKLQDCCILTFLEMSQKHLLAVWHFKHIVMDVRLILGPLPEDSRRELVLEPLALVIGPTKLYGLVETKLGAGKNTNRRCVTDRTTDFTQRVELLEVNHASVGEVGPNDDFGLKVVDHAREHDVVFKVRS